MGELATCSWVTLVLVPTVKRYILTVVDLLIDYKTIPAHGVRVRSIKEYCITTIKYQERSVTRRGRGKLTHERISSL